MAEREVRDGTVEVIALEAGDPHFATIALAVDEDPLHAAMVHLDLVDAELLIRDLLLAGDAELRENVLGFLMDGRGSARVAKRYEEG